MRRQGPLAAGASSPMPLSEERFRRGKEGACQAKSGRGAQSIQHPTARSAPSHFLASRHATTEAGMVCRCEHGMGVLLPQI